MDWAISRGDQGQASEEAEVLTARMLDWLLRLMRGK